MSMKKTANDVVIIGGGAAGMFASILAAERGLRVLLLERNDRLGKKLAITGKGRCNVTNACTAEEVIKNIPRNPRFFQQPFRLPTGTDDGVFRGERLPFEDRARQSCFSGFRSFR